MASHVFVVDTSMKRTQIKVSPGKYLREVLEEACKARRLDPESYMLKTQNNKQIDLTKPFRLSGLSAGAKLQLTQASRSIGVVNVALQLPESEGGLRLTDKFPSSTSLWMLLRRFEDGVAGQSAKKLNLTQRGVPSNQSSGSGRLEYEFPVLNLMGRNLESFLDLQKTLSQLGINTSSALLRLTFRNNGQPLDEAMKDIEQFFNAVEPVPTEVVSAATQGAEGSQAEHTANVTSVQETSLKDGGPSAEHIAGVNADEADRDDTPMTDAVDAIHAQSLDQAPAASSCEAQPAPAESPPSTINGISVYQPPSRSTPAAALQDDDPLAYEPTIEQAKRHQAMIQQSTHNKRLPSDKEIEEKEQERQNRLAAIKQVTVRVRYPDQAMTEFSMSANDTSADLYTKVMGTLRSAPEPFELRYTGIRHSELLPNSPSQRLVRDFGFRGSMLVTLAWAEGASNAAKSGPSLKDEYLASAKELKVNLQSQQAVGEEGHRAAMAKKDPPGPKKGGGGDLESKMKKFLGFGKK